VRILSRRATRWTLALLAAATWLSLSWVWWLGRQPQARETTLHGILQASGRLHGFSPDGQTLITSDALTGQASNGTGLVTLWNVSAGQRQDLKGQRQHNPAVAVAPDARTIATTSPDGTVRIWNAHTLELLTQFAGQPGKVNVVALAPGNKTLASVDSDGSVRIWEVATGKERRLPLSANTVEFAPDGKTLAVIKYDSVALWDVATGQEGRTLTMPPLWRAVFSPDGRKLATSHANGNVMLWDLDTGEAQVVFVAPEASLLAFAPDGKVLAVSFLNQSSPATQFQAWIDSLGVGQFTDGSATVLVDVTDARELVRLPGRSYGTFFPNGKVLVTWHVQDDRVELWDVPPQTLLHPIFTWITLGLAVALSAAWWFSACGSSLSST
jgi:WD40 repeat protein